MRNDLTDVTVVLDRSGSMQSCREVAQGGLNHFISEQQKQRGDCLLTLVQFDTEYEFVHQGVPIADVPPFTLHPRGGTALLDAIGRAINEAGERLAAMDESQRPGLVVFVIVTDGEENSSREFSRSQIKSMIEHQKSRYQWQFTFLGANQDAFAEAAAIGIDRDSTATYDVECAQEAFVGATANVARLRTAASLGNALFSGFTVGERDAMANKAKKPKK